MIQIQNRKFVFFNLLYLLPLVNPAQLTAQELTYNNCSTFNSQLEDIKNAKSSTQKEIMMEEINKKIERGEFKEISIDNIDDISSFLNDENDLVRFWAAASLGHIGPNAARAIPALKTALVEVKAYYPGPSTGVTSASAICVALSRISAGDILKECDGE